MVGSARTLLLPTALASLAAKHGARQEGRGTRQERIFNPINVINFPNLECTDDAGVAGECYTASECAGRGGTSSNTCASGFGVCCYILMTSCGGTVTRNNTYLRNPGYAGSYNTPGTCTYKVSKISTDDICFIRLDFETMVLASPTTGVASGNTDGTCTIDQQTITEGVSRRGIFYPPQFCGIGTGLHMYLNAFAGLDVSATIALTIGSASTTARKWNIRVTQIECDNLGRPPTTECLQYYTGAAGTFQSWNFDGGHYTMAQHYGICIRREGGYCGVQYAMNDSPNSFTWGSNPASGGRGGQTGCAHTFLAIPGSSPSGSPVGSVERYCGAVLGASSNTAQAGSSAVRTYRTPFRVYVHRKDQGHNYDATKPRNGMKIDYSQLIC